MNALMLYKRWGVDAAITATGGNGPDGTQNYVAVTIQSSEVSSALSDFPVYVRLSDLPAAFWSGVQSDGGDIRVTEDDGSTRAPVELVSIDTGGSTGELHFKASSVSASSNTTYRVYYNGSTTLSQPAVGDTYGRNAVWSDYLFVGHDGGGTDSSGNLTMTATNVTPGGATGQIGDATEFPATSATVADRIESSETLSLPLDSDWAWQMWAKTNSGNGTTARYMDNSRLHVWFTDNSDTVIWYVGSFPGDSDGYQRVDASTNAVTKDTWEMWHGVTEVGNDQITTYRDGSNVVDSRAAGSIEESNGVLVIGNNEAQDRAIEATLDEVRVRSSDLSVDWMATEHTNQNAPATFYSVGSEQSA